MGDGVTDQIQDTGIFSGLDAAQQQVVDVPQAFNDTSYVSGGMPAPDQPGFFTSQSMVTGSDGSISYNPPEGGDPSGSGGTLIDTGRYSQGFMDTAAKILNQLRGNTGQDRNVYSGRARPQRSIADLLGLGASSGAVNAQAPGNQGMWMILVVIGAIIAVLFFARR